MSSEEPQVAAEESAAPGADTNPSPSRRISAENAAAAPAGPAAEAPQGWTELPDGRRTKVTATGYRRYRPKPRRHGAGCSVAIRYPARAKVMIGAHPASGAVFVHPSRGVLGKVSADGFLSPGKLLAELRWEWGKKEYPRFELNGRWLPIKKQDGGTVTLYPNTRVFRGRVVDPKGRGVPGVRVDAGKMWDDPKGEGWTDAEGFFSIPQLSPRRVRVEVHGKGLLPMADVLWIPESTDATELTLRVWPAETVRMRLLADGGVPIAGAKVYARYGHPFHTQMTDSGGSPSISDASGLATVQVPPGEYFNAWADGPKPYHKGWLAVRGGVDRAEVTMYMRARGEFLEPWIPVTDPRVTTAVPKDLKVCLSPYDRPWETRGVGILHLAEGPDGRPVLDIPNVRPGRYRVSIWSPNFEPIEFDAEATAEGVPAPYSSAPRVDTESGADITLVDPDGSPIPIGRVWVQGADHSARFHTRRTSMAWICPRGKLPRVSLPPGLYRVDVHPENQPDLATRWVEFAVPGPPVVVRAFKK